MLKSKTLFFFMLFAFLCNSISGSNDLFIDTLYSKEEARSIVTKMGDELWAIRELDYNLAVTKGMEAMKIADYYGLDSEIIRISNFLGVLNNYNLYDSEMALSYFHQAMEMSIILDDSVQLAYAYNNLADVFLTNWNLSLSLEYTNKSLEIFERLKHKKGIAYGYVNLGAIYQREQKFDLALKCFSDAMEIREERNDTLGQNQIIISVADIYLQKGDLDKAYELYTESYSQFFTRENILYSAICLEGIGNVLSQQGKIQESIDYYNRAKELFLSRNIIIGLVDCYNGIALAYAKMGNQKKGEEALENSKILSRQPNLRYLLLDNFKVEAEFYQILNNYEGAFRSLSKYIEKNDSILFIHKMETLEELQKGYTIQKNIDKLNEELKDRKTKELYLVIIILLMILVVFVFVWRYVLYRRLNRKLISSVQTKDKLFSVISHDLKSPFNSILGYSEILIDIASGEENNKVAQYAEIINSSSKENLKLLNNLLDWSRSQTGKFKFQPEEIELDDLFKLVYDFFKIDLSKNNIQLKYSSSIQSAIVADGNILRTVLINIISNAIKYTHEGGHIDIIASTSNSKVVINVVDDGVGMSGSVINKLFKLSETESMQGVRNELGTGLGLMICYELMQIHHGDIKVTSTVGAGSNFEITFPMQKVI